jgi:hypothetical protein
LYGKGWSAIADVPGLLVRFHSHDARSHLSYLGSGSPGNGYFILMKVFLTFQQVLLKAFLLKVSKFKQILLKVLTVC